MGNRPGAQQLGNGHNDNASSPKREFSCQPLARACCRISISDHGNSGMIPKQSMNQLRGPGARERWQAFFVPAVIGRRVRRNRLDPRKVRDLHDDAYPCSRACTGFCALTGFCSLACSGLIRRNCKTRLYTSGWSPVCISSRLLRMSDSIRTGKAVSVSSSAGPRTVSPSEGVSGCDPNPG